MWYTREGRCQNYGFCLGDEDQSKKTMIGNVDNFTCSSNLPLLWSVRSSSLKPGPILTTPKTIGRLKTCSKDPPYSSQLHYPQIDHLIPCSLSVGIVAGRISNIKSVAVLIKGFDPRGFAPQRMSFCHAVLIAVSGFCLKSTQTTPALGHD